MNPTEFDSLIDREFDFYGAAENQFRLDRTTWQAIEDEDDGYRSYLGSVEVPGTAILFSQPISRVKLTRDKTDGHDFYILTDVKNAHVWLTFGTDNSDDYYPLFTFRYEPMENDSQGSLP